MDFEKIKRMREYRDELARHNDTLDKELERAKDELWETRVREIAVSELDKSISDVSWYELTRQLEYKAKWNGRIYVKIDSFYASSQLCSSCGYQNKETKDLSVRQ